jgi:hypothetical protein
MSTQPEQQLAVASVLKTVSATKTMARTSLAIQLSAIVLYLLAVNQSATSLVYYFLLGALAAAAMICGMATAYWGYWISQVVQCRPKWIAIIGLLPFAGPCVLLAPENSRLRLLAIIRNCYTRTIRFWRHDENAKSTIRRTR